MLWPPMTSWPRASWHWPGSATARRAAAAPPWPQPGRPVPGLKARRKPRCHAGPAIRTHGQRIAEGNIGCLASLLALAMSSMPLPGTPSTGSALFDRAAGGLHARDADVLEEPDAERRCRPGLIVGERHLRVVPGKYADHNNTCRPRRTLNRHPPAGRPPIACRRWRVEGVSWRITVTVLPGDLPGTVRGPRTQHRRRAGGRCECTGTVPPGSRSPSRRLHISADRRGRGKARGRQRGWWPGPPAAHGEYLAPGSAGPRTGSGGRPRPPAPRSRHPGRSTAGASR